LGTITATVACRCRRKVATCNHSTDDSRCTGWMQFALLHHLMREEVFAHLTHVGFSVDQFLCGCLLYLIDDGRPLTLTCIDGWPWLHHVRWCIHTTFLLSYLFFLATYFLLHVCLAACLLACLLDELAWRVLPRNHHIAGCMSPDTCAACITAAVCMRHNMCTADHNNPFPTSANMVGKEGVAAPVIVARLPGQTLRFSYQLHHSVSTSFL